MTLRTLSIAVALTVQAIFTSGYARGLMIRDAVTELQVTGPEGNDMEIESMPDKFETDPLGEQPICTTPARPDGLGSSERKPSRPLSEMSLYICARTREQDHGAGIQFLKVGQAAFKNWRDRSQASHLSHLLTTIFFAA